MRRGLFDQCQCGIEAAAAGGFVPAVFQRPAVLQIPARRCIGWCKEHAQSALRGEVDPAFVDARQIGNAGDAGKQHLAERHLFASLARSGSGCMATERSYRPLMYIEGTPCSSRTPRKNGSVLGCECRFIRPGITIRSVPSIIVSAAPS